MCSLITSRPHGKRATFYLSLTVVVVAFLSVFAVDCDRSWAAGNEDVPANTLCETHAVIDNTNTLGSDSTSSESDNRVTGESGEAAKPVQQVLSSGWNYMSGLWKYGSRDGHPYTGWLKWKGSWYWLDPEHDGAMGTGWQLVGGAWYHLASSGVMDTGWLRLGRTWYHLSSSGAMATQWSKIGGAWYYFGDSGAMATGWQLVGGTWYHLASSGVMDTGWLRLGRTWYHLSSSGAMATQWSKIGGAWYYFGDSGAMATGWRLVGDRWYHLASSGVMDTGWFKSGDRWYYLGGDGAMRTGWYKVRGQWNYSNADGVWCESKWVKSGSRWWYKRADGTYPVNTWEKINGKWYHFDAAGWMETGWLHDGDDWYWLDSSGAMATDALVDKGRYYVGSDGRWQQATAKLYVLAGHGGGDPGASGNGYNEEWCTRYLAKKLKEFGGDAVMLNDLATNPKTSGVISTMQLPLDTQLLCIHLDSSVASARGGHVIIGNRQPTAYDRALATTIGSLFPGRPQTLVHRTDLVDVARAAKRGYEYRLLEVCMITNRSDMQKFIADTDEIARAILRSFDIEPVK